MTRHAPQPRSIFEPKRRHRANFDDGEHFPKRASNSGTDARIIAMTSMTMMQTISRTKREPTE